ncbi:hypothetical protein VU06_01995 [Desulfobulbus sp. F3]|nr:hypothetical protein [Desulfobulbus sp. F3]
MKKIIAACLVLAFSLAAGAAMAGTGTVKKIDGDKVTIACKSKNKKAMLKAGDKVELKGTAKDAAAAACTVDKAAGGKVELTCENAVVKVGQKVSVMPASAQEEPKAEVKEEANAEAKEEPKADAKEEAKPEVKEEIKAEAKEEAKGEVKEEPKAEGK